MTDASAAAKDTRSFYPHTALMKELAEGDWLVLDPFYGVEKVQKVSLHTTGMGELPDTMYSETIVVITVERITPGFDPFEAKAFRRGIEPVTIWRQEDTLPADIREWLASIRTEIDAITPGTPVAA